jgi:arginase
VTRWALVGAPADSVLRGGGAERSPARLRELGLAERLGGVDAGDLRVHVRGNVRDPVTGIIGSDEVIENTRVVREAVRERIGAGERVFVAGGCCANAPGAIAGARDVVGRIGLAYIDGHQDMWDGQSSTTGEAADMPLAVTVGIGPPEWVEAIGGAAVAASDVVLLGDRDHDETSAAGLPDPSARGVHHLPIERVRAMGPGGAGADARRILEQAAPAGVWLHLDVDVLDMRVFPATDYLDPDGMAMDELRDLLTPLARSERLVGMSLGCFNPEKDPDGACGEALVSLLEEALGSAVAGGQR